jgi:hypothetical protein
MLQWEIMDTSGYRSRYIPTLFQLLKDGFKDVDYDS